MEYICVVRIILWNIGFVGYLISLPLLKRVELEAFWYESEVILGVFVVYTGIILSIQR